MAHGAQHRRGTGDAQTALGRDMLGVGDDPVDRMFDLIAVRLHEAAIIDADTSLERGQRGESGPASTLM